MIVPVPRLSLRRGDNTTRPCLAAASLTPPQGRLSTEYDLRYRVLGQALLGELNTHAR